MKTHSIILILLLATLFPIGISAQAKKPTIMVIPADTWCSENGYLTTYENQGFEVRVPDYAKAIQENTDLLIVTTKIGELMSERGFPLKDMSQTLKSANNNNARNAMMTSKTSGAALAENPIDKLNAVAKADILIEIGWKINKTGPKQSVTYIMRGLDAYSNKQVAAAQGTGAASFSSEVPVLLEEAVLEKMDGFLSQLQSHFEDLLENGREVAFSVKVFDNGSGISLEDEFDGEELTDVIEAWMAQNTVNHRFNMTDATENQITFEQVRIPIYRENGMPMDTRQFVNNLRKHLRAEPYNIVSKVDTQGLGRADLIIGEK